jgi:nucleoside-diphosphate-sugar epimerase
MNKILVLGAGGFIGHHMVSRLKSNGYYVVGVDIKYPEFETTKADQFLILDLCNSDSYKFIDHTFDEIYQFAADMGGAGYIFTGENDFNIMSGSSSININLLRHLVVNGLKPKIFYSSSACVYPEELQVSNENSGLLESDAYPANPDSEYGWEKLFSERLYLSAKKNYGIDVKIARYHNVYGPLSTWSGGKEKAPAALCRKIIESNGEIEIWGDGEQTRSFLYIDDCIDGTLELMQSSKNGPYNIGSSESISINSFAKMISSIENKQVTIKNIPGPKGVNGRNSNNTLTKSEIGWSPKVSLKDGISKTYFWIKSLSFNNNAL